jgi:AcrR family transcriptional regulator
LSWITGQTYPVNGGYSFTVWVIHGAGMSKVAGVVNKSGQSLGRKGQGTRLRVIEAAEALLAQSRGIAPSVAAIAREAGISPPTFYLYFTDAGEAILAAVGQSGARFEDVTALLREDWPQDQLYERSHAFVSAYFAVWRENATLLRARNRLADEGDPRFVRLRIDSITQMAEPMTAKLGPGIVDGKIVTEAAGITNVILTALERMATVIMLGLYDDEHFQLRGNIEALAYVLVSHLKK